MPGLSGDDEKALGFERVAADLTQPDSISTAVEKSGATHAFFYGVHGSTDFMQATIWALKLAGIQFAVFISSYTVTGELEDIPSSEITPYVHARVEMNLKQIFGPKDFVAVRAGSFATNTLWFKTFIRQGVVPLFCPDVQFDWVAPEDVGTVCGSFLAKGRADEATSYAFVLGPNLLTQEKALAIIAKHLGRDIKFQDSTEEEEIYRLVNTARIPEGPARYIATKLKDQSQGIVSFYPNQVVEDGVKTIQKHAKRPAMSFSEWVEKNKNLFL
jgi:hypothetical protein